MMAYPYICLVRCGWRSPPKMEVAHNMKFTIETTLQELLTFLWLYLAVLRLKRT